MPHRPKTYETQEIEGVTSFKTYDQRLVSTCDPADTNLTCLDIAVGTYFNDLWRYQLGSCSLASPQPCNLATLQPTNLATHEPTNHESICLARLHCVPVHGAWCTPPQTVFGTMTLAARTKGGSS